MACTNMKRFFFLSWPTEELIFSYPVTVRVHLGCNSFRLPLPILASRLVFTFAILREYLATLFGA